MVVSLLPKPRSVKAGDHHFMVPVVSPVQRPPVPASPRVW